MAVNYEGSSIDLRSKMNEVRNTAIADSEEYHPGYGYSKYEVGSNTNVQAHHIIPIDVVNDNNKFFDKLDVLGSTFKLDEAENGVFLPASDKVAQAGYDKGHFASVHSGSHIAYSEYVSDHLGKLSQDFDAEIKALNPSTDANKRIIAKKYMGKIHILQENLRDGLINVEVNGKTKLQFFLNGRDPELHRRGITDIETPDLNRKMSDEIYNKFDDDFNKKMTSPGIVYRSYDPDGSRVNHFNASVNKNIKGIANVNLLAGVASAGIIALTAASLIKITADYLDKEDIPC